MRLDPHFRLIENGVTTPGADIRPEAASVIYVTRHSVRELIAGLLSDADMHVVRDPSAPPPSPTVPSGQVWLQTSGTTGTPKWIGHTRAHLGAKITGGGDKARWLLTFNPGSFAGVQVILSAMAGGHDLVAPDYGATVADLADLAMREQVTHISGTPTFWRAFLMALGDRALALKSVTLGGEAADQAILDVLNERFPQAHLRHIYATTEAGTVFSVRDGQAGFPKDWLGSDLSVTARDTLAVKGLDTGDVVEIVDDRVLFRGRIDAMVNVGGVKVYPETVEAFLQQLSFIQDARISARPNPITGHVLIADIVLKAGEDSDLAPAQIKAHLSGLPRAQRPVTLRFVDHIDMGATGKKSRTTI